MKHIRRMIVVLSLTLIASTAFALRMELAEDYGAALTADCVEPCTDYYIHSIIECRHLNPAGCETDQCAINSLRYLKCTVPSGGSDEVLCDWTTDPNDWGRWVVAREMPCPKPHNAHTHTYAACEGSPYATEFTPCVASQCFGTLRRDSAEEMNRPICN